MGQQGRRRLPGIKDAVHYGSGEVQAVDTPKPHLKGTLKCAKNSDQYGQMVETSALTYDVEIFPDGTLSYLMKLNGQPVGGMPPTKVQATCVNNVLLTATDRVGGGNRRCRPANPQFLPPLNHILGYG